MAARDSLIRVTDLKKYYNKGHRQYFPVSTLLEEISSKYGTDFGLMASSVTIIVIPVMLVYVFLQKNIIKGLTAGAIKG